MTTPDALTADDLKELAEIYRRLCSGEHDGIEQLIHAYWHKPGRAERTPIVHAMMHMGFLTGIIAVLRAQLVEPPI